MKLLDDRPQTKAVVSYELLYDTLYQKFYEISCKCESSPLLLHLKANDFFITKHYFSASFIDENVKFVHWTC